MARHNAKHAKRRQSAQKADSHKKISRTRKKFINPEEQEQYCRKIRTFLQMTDKGRMQKQELAQKCHSRRNIPAYQSAMEKLLKKGVILEPRQALIILFAMNIIVPLVLAMSE